MLTPEEFGKLYSDLCEAQVAYDMACAEYDKRFIVRKAAAEKLISLRERFAVATDSALKITPPCDTQESQPGK